MAAGGRLAVATRAGLVTAALVAAGAALAQPAFRRAVDGSLLPAGWAAAVAAMAVAIVACTWRTRWQSAGAFFALAVASQSAELILIDVPSASAYEHYRAWTDLASWPTALLLAVPVLQLLASLLGTRRLVLDPARIGLTPGRLATLAFVSLGALAVGRFETGRYATELALAVLVALANLVNMIVIAAAIPADAIRSAGSAIDRAGRWLAPACAAFAFLASAMIAVLVLDRTPVVPDAVSYLFQAKYFAAGRLALPAPPELPAFAFDKMHSDGATWWAYGFPGWPAVLAMGVRLGAPWLVNPVLAGLTVLIAHALLSGLYGAPFARRATLLLAVSPWFLFMSASHMGHTVSLFWVSASLLALHLAWRSRRSWWAALAGGTLAASFLTRPLEAILLAPAIGLSILGVTGQRLRWSGVAAFLIGGAAVTSILFAYNRGVTGDPLRTPHSVYADARDYPGADRLGFGPEVGNLGWTHLDPLPGHGAADVVINAQQNAYMVQTDLFGWRFGSAVLLLAFVVAGRRRREDRLFLLMAASIVLGHSVYWFSGGPDIGARYWYQVLIPLIVLTVRGAQEMEATRTGREPGGTGRVGAFMAAASLAALVAFVPWRSLGKYHDYRGMNADLARMAKARGFGHALVFIREHDPSDYSRALILNTPGFPACSPVYARDLGPESRLRIQRLFPDRTWWIIEGPAETGLPLTVVEGPVAAQQPGARCGSNANP